MSAEAYPLQWPDGWPRHKGARENDNRFRGPAYRWDRVYRGLVSELARIGGKNIVVSTNQPIRRDGAPYAQERIISDVGVAVYFMRGKQSLVMAQDRFYTIIGNMRSLAMAVEGLRQMERHGGAVMMERAFSGFTALPPPGAEYEPGWWDILRIPRGSSREQIVQAFRALAREHHPDLGGDPAEFAKIAAARDEALSEP